MIRSRRSSIWREGKSLSRESSRKCENWREDLWCEHGGKICGVNMAGSLNRTLDTFIIASAFRFRDG